MNDKKLAVVMLREEKVQPVLDALVEAGITGWTTTKGRGTGTENRTSFFGMTIEPEKEIIFTVVEETMIEGINQAAKEHGNIEEPGQGLFITLDVEHFAGLPFH